MKEADFGRKLESNWSRYEEPKEDDTVQFTRKRGQDFQELLSCTGGQFRFKEEGDDFQVSNFLSLDCQLVTQALHTIPIPQRLRLTKDIFPREIYQQYQDDALSLRCKHSGIVPCSLTNSLSACLKNAKKEGGAQDLLPSKAESVNLEDWLDSVLDD
ncbi:uncharacterized protein LOC135397423 isoform X2 [Ornithodoros turicata]